MRDELEIKAVDAEFKALDDKGTYEGHFAVFGNVDSGGDISEPGMFQKTIKESGHRVKVFFAHDWMKPIGPPPSMLKEDSVGLFAGGKLSIESFWGREAWVLMKDGAMPEGSFGYAAVKFDFDEDSHRHLREVKLFEISPVPLGMNMLTSVAAKSAAMSTHSSPLAERGTEWSVETEVAKAKTAADLRMMHAWFNPNGDPTNSKSYKFPHHMSDGRVNYDGLLDCASKLMAGHQSLSLDATTFEAVKQHIAKHFEDIGELPPWEPTEIDAKMAAFELLLKELKDKEILVTLDETRRAELASKIERLLEVMSDVTAAGEPEPIHLPLLDTRLRAVNLTLGNL